MRAGTCWHAGGGRQGVDKGDLAVIRDNKEPRRYGKEIHLVIVSECMAKGLTYLRQIASESLNQL